MILVTGGSGFVGSALLKQLLLNGCEVKASARSSLTAELNGVQHHPIYDITASTDWSAALNRVQTVVHCAARVHVMADSAADPLAEFRRVNVDGTLNLARQAAASGVARFVFVSSVKVNGEATVPGRSFTERDAPAPQDPYGQSKHEAELGLRQLVADTGMEVVIVRPPLVYGLGVKANFAALMRAVQRGWPLPLGGGSQPAQPGGAGQFGGLDRHLLGPPCGGQPDVFSKRRARPVYRRVGAWHGAGGWSACAFVACAGVGLAGRCRCLGQGRCGAAFVWQFAGRHQQSAVFVGLGATCDCCRRAATGHGNGG